MNQVVVEEVIRRHRLTPAQAGLRNARHRIGRKSFHQYSRSLVQARITQVQLFKLRCCPVRPCGRQLIQPKGDSNRENGQVYKGRRNSLNVKGFFGQVLDGPDLCITPCLKAWHSIRSGSHGLARAQCISVENCVAWRRHRAG